MGLDSPPHKAFAYQIMKQIRVSEYCTLLLTIFFNFTTNEVLTVEASEYAAFLREYYFPDYFYSSVA